MDAHTKAKRNIQGNENATSKTKNLMNAVATRKNSKTNIPKLKTKATNPKEIDSNLGLPKCTRGVVKRTALGSIANTALLTSNKNGRAGLIKKIEASKALVGLKSKKDRPINPVNVQNTRINPEPMQIEESCHKPVFKLPRTVFKLPEGVDNIDAEW